jgi:hypothetical protein
MSTPVKEYVCIAVKLGYCSKSLAVWHLDNWKSLMTAIFAYAPLQFM